MTDDTDAVVAPSLAMMATTAETDLQASIDAGATIAQQLADSRAAHVAYRAALLAQQWTDAKLQLAKAARLRQEAHDADPDHLAPCWQDERETHPHADLLAFYAAQLAK